MRKPMKLIGRWWKYLKGIELGSIGGGGMEYHVLGGRINVEEYMQTTFI